MSFGIDALKIKDKDFLVLVLAGLIFVSLAPLPVLSPILIILLGVFFGILIISLFAPEDFVFLFNLYLVGFGVRLFFSFLFYIASFVLPNNQSPGFIFPNDGWCYSEQGWQIYRFAERGIRVTMKDFLNNPNMMVWGSSGNITPYDFFTSHVYSVTGYSPLSLFFISSLAGSLAALFIYLIAKELFSKKVARISSLLAFFWPSLILWATQNLKEPMIALLSFMTLWSIFHFFNYFNPLFLCLPIFSLYLLFKVSFPFSIIISGTVFFVAVFLFLGHLFKSRIVVLLIIGLFALGLIIFLKHKVLSIAFSRSNYDITNYKSIFEFLNYHRGVRAYGNLQFLRGADISSPGKMATFAPIGLIYAIFAPFPWQMGNFMQVIAIPETIIFYLLVPFSIRGMVSAYKRHFNKSIVLLLVISGTFIFLALVEGNSGTIFRHRSLVFYLVFIFASHGIFLKDEKY